MKKNYEIDFTQGRLTSKIISFAIPLMLSGILQLAFNAADLVVVGRFSGENSLAAVGSNSVIISLVVNLLLGLGTGTSVLVSRYFGAKDEDSLLDTVGTTVILGVIGGVLFALLGIFSSDWFLRIMATPPEVLPLAKTYLQIYYAGLPVIMLYNFAGAALRAIGDSKRPLYYLAIAGVLNVGLNLFFVIVLKMDVAGVALATVLSQCVSCYLTIRCLIRSKTICRLEMHPIRFSAAQLKEILRIGLPAGIQSSLFAISNVLIQSSINSFGAMVMAGSTAASSIEAFMYVSQDAMYQAAVSSVGQNMGAREYPRVRRSVRCCLLLICIISVVFSAVAIVFRVPLLRIYTSEPEAISSGSLRMLVICTFFFAGGIQHLLGGIMRGHGYSILPTLVSLLGVCGFRILWIYSVFAKHHTLEVLYASYPISWVLTILALGVCYFLLRDKAYDKNEQQFLAADKG